MLKFIKKLILMIVVLGIIGGGWFYYTRYKNEKLKRIAKEERKKQEEMEKERERKLLEEKRKLYDEFVSEIERYFKEGKNYKKVKELIEEALKIAKEYNFPKDKIEAILYQMKVNGYIGQLKKLEKENEDIYKYLYVRSQIQKIPSLKETSELKNRILKKTYENEYRVKLLIAKKSIEEGKEGNEPVFNYFLSRKIGSDIKNLRASKNINKDRMEEDIENLQNELFFASEELHKNTIPSSLY